MMSVYIYIYRLIYIYIYIYINIHRDGCAFRETVSSMHFRSHDSSGEICVLWQPHRQGQRGLSKYTHNPHMPHVHPSYPYQEPTY